MVPSRNTTNIIALLQCIKMCHQISLKSQHCTIPCLQLLILGGLFELMAPWRMCQKSTELSMPTKLYPSLRLQVIPLEAPLLHLHQLRLAYIRWLVPSALLATTLKRTWSVCQVSMPSQLPNARPWATTWTPIDMSHARLSSAWTVIATKMFHQYLPQRMMRMIMSPSRWWQMPIIWCVCHPLHFPSHLIFIIGCSFQILSRLYSQCVPCLPPWQTMHTPLNRENPGWPLVQDLPVSTSVFFLHFSFLLTAIKFIEGITPLSNTQHSLLGI